MQLTLIYQRNKITLQLDLYFFKQDKLLSHSISQDLDAETFEVMPKDVYTADDSRVNREHDAKSWIDGL